MTAAARCGVGGDGLECARVIKRRLSLGVYGGGSLELIAMRRRPHRRSPRPLYYDGGLESRREACAAKERYTSEAEARSIALMNAPRGKRASTTPYQCDVCGGWHLTSR